jgi:hypothetical protein
MTAKGGNRVLQYRYLIMRCALLDVPFPHGWPVSRFNGHGFFTTRSNHPASFSRLASMLICSSPGLTTL